MEDILEELKDDPDSNFWFRVAKYKFFARLNALTLIEIARGLGSKFPNPVPSKAELEREEIPQSEIDDVLAWYEENSAF